MSANPISPPVTYTPPPSVPPPAGRAARPETPEVVTKPAVDPTPAPKTDTVSVRSGSGATPPAAETAAQADGASRPRQAITRAYVRKNSESAAPTRTENGEVAGASAKTPRLDGEGVQESRQEEMQRERLEEAVQRMNDLVGAVFRNVNYRLNDDPEKLYVEIVDADTERVIRTLPPQSMLDRMDRLYSMLGLIFDELG